MSLSVRVDSPSAHNVTVHHQLENASSFIRSSEHLQGLFHCCVTPNNNTQNLLQNTTPPPHPFSGVSHCFLHAQRNNQTASFYCPHQMEGSEYILINLLRMQALVNEEMTQVQAQFCHHPITVIRSRWQDINIEWWEGLKGFSHCEGSGRCWAIVLDCPLLERYR